MTQTEVFNNNAKLFVNAERVIDDCLRTSIDSQRTLQLIHNLLAHIRYAVNDDAIYTPFSERMMRKLSVLYKSKV